MFFFSIEKDELKNFYAMFVRNTKWLLNKSSTCRSLLYFIHDLELYKANSIDHAKSDEFVQFEKAFYKLLFELYQDPTQITTYMSLHKIKGDFTTAKEPVQLIPVNYEHLMSSYSLAKEAENISPESPQSIFFSRVMFLNTNCVLTLSESQNEIKIWRVNKETSELNLIRSIKFDKSPKDLRLLNKHTAIVLFDRNLHLIDLNRCKHLLDLNSTMNPNVPLFEIHDQQHVVLLARNRLSVILMKVPVGNAESEEPEQEQNKIQKYKQNSPDDMFLFKVGEDRYLNSLLVSRNGQVMVCGDEVQKPFPLLVWNLNHRKLVYDLRQAKHEFITSIQSIGSSGRFVVCACQVSFEFFFFVE